jgi:hypothetical protein
MSPASPTNRTTTGAAIVPIIIIAALLIAGVVAGFHVLSKPSPEAIQKQQQEALRLEREKLELEEKRQVLERQKQEDDKKRLELEAVKAKQDEEIAKKREAEEAKRREEQAKKDEEETQKRREIVEKAREEQAKAAQAAREEQEKADADQRAKLKEYANGNEISYGFDKLIAQLDDDGLTSDQQSEIYKRNGEDKWFWISGRIDDVGTWLGSKYITIKINSGNYIDVYPRKDFDLLDYRKGRNISFIGQFTHQGTGIVTHHQAKNATEVK